MVSERQPFVGSEGAGRTPLRTRRDLVGALGLGAAVLTLQGCGDGQSEPAAAVEESGPAGNAVDYASRFADFAPADEPNGVLSRVDWPDFVLRAGSDVKRLYEFQVLNGSLMRYMPCFCGCKDEAGHRNNRDCYIKSVNADGSVVFDAMAPT
ncbi:MAG: PCYCGC domain-containing protein [Chloroflexota bacterium]|nr:PCYCGC domain-containing protein [Chloroflexota bacterium]